jgi:protein-S-isoprenylcysteine O-methyltransferase Ste14
MEHPHNPLRNKPKNQQLSTEDATMTIPEIYRILFWAWMASEIITVILTHTSRTGGDVQDRGSLRLLWVVIFTAITCGSWIGQANPHTIFPGNHWIPAACLALLILGLAIRWTAILTLGRSFSVNVAIHATQTVHKTGLFRFVRHPSYSGLILIFMALGLATRNWLGFAVLILPILAALSYRIHVEESALSRAFGPEYDDYSKATKRLIPGIY